MIDVDRQIFLQILTSAREVFLPTNGKIYNVIDGMIDEIENNNVNHINLTHKWVNVSFQLRADENCHQWDWPAVLDIDPEVIRNVKISESN